MFRGTNEKINRCLAEPTDILLGDVGYGCSGGRYVKKKNPINLLNTHKHTNPIFISKGADGLIPAPDPFILLRMMKTPRLS